jgi:threonine/homoserine/homoserine lactone efflux protein
VNTQKESPPSKVWGKSENAGAVNSRNFLEGAVTSVIGVIKFVGRCCYLCYWGYQIFWKVLLPLLLRLSNLLEGAVTSVIGVIKFVGRCCYLCYWGYQIFEQFNACNFLSL